MITDRRHVITVRQWQVVPDQRGDRGTVKSGNTIEKAFLPAALIRGESRQHVGPVQMPAVIHLGRIYGVKGDDDQADPVEADRDDRTLTIRAHGRDEVAERGPEPLLVPFGPGLPGNSQPSVEFSPHVLGHRANPRPGV